MNNRTWLICLNWFWTFSLLVSAFQSMIFLLCIYMKRKGIPTENSIVFISRFLSTKSTIIIEAQKRNSLTINIIWFSKITRFSISRKCSGYWNYYFYRRQGINLCNRSTLHLNKLVKILLQFIKFIWIQKIILYSANKINIF